MTFVYVNGDTNIRLWGLSPRERFVRQAGQIKGTRFIDDLGQLGERDSVLIVDSGYVMEVRTLEGLLNRTNVALRCPAAGKPAAVHVSAADAAHAVAFLNGDHAALPEKVEVIDPADLQAFDKTLRRSAPPLLEPITERTRGRLEDELYGNAYKGITDLVTKFFWPRPAKHVVRWCANLGITPNAVTITGLLLMLLAGLMFAEGYYLIGLVPGWIMTFLDTVDGKLARVTVQSSRFGHVLDHGMDILHPPFWYVLWGMGLAGETLLLPRADYYGIIFIGYIVGRLCEAQFHALGSCSIFGWRPFDAYFRLITARRNTCMILLTLFVALGRPDWAFLAVVFWTVFTTAVLVGRLAYGAFVRATSGPLKSWLADPETAARENARAYRLFSVTRGAYAEG